MCHSITKQTNINIVTCMRILNFPILHYTRPYAMSPDRHIMKWITKSIYIYIYIYIHIYLYIYIYIIAYCFPGNVSELESGPHAFHSGLLSLSILLRIIAHTNLDCSTCAHSFNEYYKSLRQTTHPEFIPPAVACYLGQSWDERHSVIIMI